MKQYIYLHFCLSTLESERYTLFVFFFFFKLFLLILPKIVFLLFIAALLKVLRTIRFMDHRTTTRTITTRNTTPTTTTSTTTIRRSTTTTHPHRYVRSQRTLDAAELRRLRGFSSNTATSTHHSSSSSGSLRSDPPSRTALHSTGTPTTNLMQMCRALRSNNIICPQDQLRSSLSAWAQYHAASVLLLSQEQQRDLSRRQAASRQYFLFNIGPPLREIVIVDPTSATVNGQYGEDDDDEEEGVEGDENFTNTDAGTFLSQLEDMLPKRRGFMAGCPICLEGDDDTDADRNDDGKELGSKNPNGEQQGFHHHQPKRSSNSRKETWITDLPCTHSFCTACFARWLRYHDSCPLCRMQVELCRRR